MNEVDKTLALFKDRSPGIICARCDQPTYNNNQGHYWAYCKVTQTVRAHHFCCPNDCQLEEGKYGSSRKYK